MRRRRRETRGGRPAEEKPVEEKPRPAAADAIIAAMGDGLVLLNLDGTIASINPALEKMFGYEKSEYVGKDVADTIPKMIKPEEMEKIMEAMGKFLDEKTPTPKMIVTAISKDGREVPTSLSTSFVKDAEGKPTHVVITVKDITELKKLITDVETAKAYTDSIIASTADTLLILDMDGTVLNINPAGEKLVEQIGIKLDELIGSSVTKIAERIVTPEAVEKIVEILGNATTGKAGTVELELSTKDNKKLPIQFSVSLIKDAAGKPIGIVGVGREITELKKIAEERTNAAAAADKARIEELEKFAKLTTGREQRIIELKRRVKELEEKLKAK